MSATTANLIDALQQFANSVPDTAAAAAPMSAAPNPNTAAAAGTTSAASDPGTGVVYDGLPGKPLNSDEIDTRGDQGVLAVYYGNTDAPDGSPVWFRAKVVAVYSNNGETYIEVAWDDGDTNHTRVHISDVRLL